jgi:hypothetical protein
VNQVPTSRNTCGTNVATMFRAARAALSSVDIFPNARTLAF